VKQKLKNLENVSAVPQQRSVETKSDKFIPALIRSLKTVLGTLYFYFFAPNKSGNFIFPAVP